jgi:hypothetical protein
VQEIPGHCTFGIVQPCLECICTLQKSRGTRYYEERICWLQRSRFLQKVYQPGLCIFFEEPAGELPISLRRKYIQVMIFSRHIVTKPIVSAFWCRLPYLLHFSMKRFLLTVAFISRRYKHKSYTLHKKMMIAQKTRRKNWYRKTKEEITWGDGVTNCQYIDYAAIGGATTYWPNG